MNNDIGMSASSDNADSELFSINLAEALRAIRMRPILIAACIVVCAAAFTFRAMRQRKVYSAVAEIVMEPMLPKILGEGFDVDERATRASAESAFFNTQYNIIQSRAVYRESISRLGLTKDTKFLEAYEVTTSDEEAKIKAAEAILRGAVLVAPTPHSRIVKLIVEDYDPNRAARIANTVGQVYIDQSLESRLAATRNASKWLDKRVDEYQVELEGAEKALADFKRSNMLVSVSLEDRKNMVAAKLSAMNQQLIETRNKLIALESERAVAKKAASRTGTRDDLESVPRIAKSERVGGLKTTLVTLEQKRAELSSRYGARHPNMLAVQNQIDGVDALINKEIRLIVQALDNEIEALKGIERAVDAEMQTQVQKAMNLNNLALDYAKLSRKLGTTKETYGALLKRRTETDLSGLLETNFVRWLQTAEPRPWPIRPSVPIQTVIGILFGLALGLGIAIGGVLLDNTIHTQSEIEERLKLAFLGLLPKIEDEKKERKPPPPEGEMRPGYSRARDLFIVENPKSAVAECARSVRTNLMFMGAEKPIRRLLLTSAGPSEGKSTTAIALGSTMALAGSRVLIIDTDLRRPRLHKTFGVSGEVGLTSILLETASMDDAIKSTDVHGLELLPCGPLPPNPSELLHTERFEKLMDRLGEHYDRILLDSPPVNAVTDASILSQIADGTILVVKASQTTKEAARRAARQLRDVKANVLGVVLNNVDLKEGGYYRDHYYQYYRTGYAYGSDAENS